MKSKIKYPEIMKLTVFFIALMAVVQAARYGIKCFIFAFTGVSDFKDRLASFIAMALLTAVILIIVKIRKAPVSFVPKKFGAFNVVITILYFAVLVVTFIIESEHTFSAAFLIAYSSIMTPVFEEIIFRGYMWEKLSEATDSEWLKYIYTSVMFAIWHLGYADSLALRANGNIGTILFWKVMTGLFFGIVLGFVRVKAKNCYVTMILHGVLNAVGK